MIKPNAMKNYFNVPRRAPGSTISEYLCSTLIDCNSVALIIIEFSYYNWIKNG